MKTRPPWRNWRTRAARGGEVVYLTEHGQRIAAILLAGVYEDSRRLREEAAIAQAIAAGLADSRPGRSFTSVEEMMDEADPA